MAKVKDYVCKHSGLTFFRSQIMVDTKGVFYVMVSSDVANTVRDYLDKTGDTKEISFSPNSRYPEKWNIRCNNMAVLLEKIESALVNTSVVGRKEEPVIVYYAWHTGFYWQDQEGNSVYPSGGKKSTAKGGRWVSGRSPFSEERTFGVGCCAKLMLKNSVSLLNRKHGIHLEFSPITLADFKKYKIGKQGQLLARYNARLPNSLNNLPCVPYTEEAAAFFCSLMGMSCQLGRVMERLNDNGLDEILASGLSFSIPALNRKE